MKRGFGILIAIALLASGSWAQQAERATASREDIEKLLAVMHVREQMQSNFDLSVKQAKEMARDTIKKRNPQMTSEQMERADSRLNQFTTTFDISGLLEDMIPVYQRHLSKQDISAMLAFYQSPTGQKLLSEQSTILSESMTAMRPRMEKMMSTIAGQGEKVGGEENGAKPELK